MQKGWVWRLDPFRFLIPLLMAAAIGPCRNSGVPDGAFEWFTDQKAWEHKLQFLQISRKGPK
jgi:hypothetical protein